MWHDVDEQLIFLFFQIKRNLQKFSGQQSLQKLTDVWLSGNLQWRFCKNNQRLSKQLTAVNYFRKNVNLRLLINTQIVSISPAQSCQDYRSEMYRRSLSLVRNIYIYIYIYIHVCVYSIHIMLPHSSTSSNIRAIYN